MPVTEGAANQILFAKPSPGQKMGQQAMLKIP